MIAVLFRLDIHTCCSSHSGLMVAVGLTWYTFLNTLRSHDEKFRLSLNLRFQHPDWRKSSASRLQVPAQVWVFPFHGHNIQPEKKNLQEEDTSLPEHEEKNHKRRRFRSFQKQAELLRPLIQNDAVAPRRSEQEPTELK